MPWRISINSAGNLQNITNSIEPYVPTFDVRHIMADVCFILTRLRQVAVVTRHVYIRRVNFPIWYTTITKHNRLLSLSVAASYPYRNDSSDVSRCCPVSQFSRAHHPILLILTLAATASPESVMRARVSLCTEEKSLFSMLICCEVNGLRYSCLAFILDSIHIHSRPTF